MTETAETVAKPDLGFRTLDGTFAVDLAQRIRAWSPVAQQMTGHTAREVLGRPCWEVIGGRDARNHKFCRRNCPVVSNARRGRLTADYDILSQRPDGSPLWLNISVLLPERQAQEAPYILHLFRDVTGRRSLEERARRALEALRAVVEAERADGAPKQEEPALPPMSPLSRRERETLRLLALGLGTERIAESLGVTRITARNHISRVLAKLGVQSRLQAVVYASQRGLV
ncbi:MAG: PAS domain S-box protein [Chloroflexi bacterium]|nr:PAS domain S-box protein [Chloroflexota bacterium]